jgi:hypothetical protein
MAFGGLVKDSLAIYLVTKVVKGGRKRPVRSVEEQTDLGQELLWVYFVLVPRAVFVMLPRWVWAQRVALRAWYAEAKQKFIEFAELSAEQEPPPLPAEALI